MKITFLLSLVAQNGGNRVIAIYAEKLREMGHEVTVLARQPKPQRLLRRILNRLRGHKGDPNRAAYYKNISDTLVQIPWKQPIEPSDVPDGDVIIATFWRTAFEVATLPPEKGKKAYFVQHHEVHPHQPWDLAAGSYYLPLKKITIANWLVATMATRYGDRDVPKVENSVDTRQFNAPPRARGTVPTVGLLYSRTPFKGVEVSLKAIDIARDRFPDLKVVAFGPSAPGPDLPLPAGSEFHRLPAQDEIRDIYAKCDVWLCGSHAEGFHLPPSEAMACRCPVVSTNVGGAVEIVEPGVNGHIVDVGDAEALGARLIDVFSLSPEAWRAMSDAAHARAQSYTWDDAARAFEAELQKIVSDAR